MSNPESQPSEGGKAGAQVGANTTSNTGVSSSPPSLPLHSPWIVYHIGTTLSLFWPRTQDRADGVGGVGWLFSYRDPRSTACTRRSGRWTPRRWPSARVWPSRSLRVWLGSCSRSMSAFSFFPLTLLLLLLLLLRVDVETSEMRAVERL